MNSRGSADTVSPSERTSISEEADMEAWMARSSGSTRTGNLFACIGPIELYDVTFRLIPFFFIILIQIATNVLNK